MRVEPQLASSINPQNEQPKQPSATEDVGGKFFKSPPPNPSSFKPGLTISLGRIDDPEDSHSDVSTISPGGVVAPTGSPNGDVSKVEKSEEALADQENKLQFAAKNHLSNLFKLHPNEPAQALEELQELIKDKPNIVLASTISVGDKTIYRLARSYSPVLQKGANKSLEGCIDDKGNLYLLAIENAPSKHKFSVRQNSLKTGHESLNYLPPLSNISQSTYQNPLDLITSDHVLVPEVLVEVDPNAEIISSADANTATVSGRMVYLSPYCKGGNLKSYLSSLSPEQRKIETIRAAHALLQAHSDLSKASLVHLDIKEENIVVDLDGQSPTYLLADTDGITDLEGYSNKKNAEGVTWNNAAPTTKSHEEADLLARSQEGTKDDTFQVGATLHRLFYDSNPPQIQDRRADDIFAAFADTPRLNMEEIPEGDDPLKRLIHLMMKETISERINGPTALACFEKITEIDNGQAQISGELPSESPPIEDSSSDRTALASPSCNSESTARTDTESPFSDLSSDTESPFSDTGGSPSAINPNTALQWDVIDSF